MSCLLRVQGVERFDFRDLSFESAGVGTWPSWSRASREYEAPEQGPHGGFGFPRFGVPYWGPDHTGILVFGVEIRGPSFS